MPISIFGGEKGFKLTQDRDIEKKFKCKNEHVKLIEIKFNEPLTVENIQKKVTAYL